MAASVEEVSSSLVREYLSRKGLKRTIACMDEEHPRTEASINNRSLLRQILNMEGLCRKNKVQNSPVKTLLEIIVKYRIMDLKNEKTNRNEQDLLRSSSAVSLNVNSPTASSNDTRMEESATVFVSKNANLRSDREAVSPAQPISKTLLPETISPSSHKQACFWVNDSEDQAGQASDASVQDNESFLRREREKPLFVSESAQKSKTNRVRRGMMTGPIASTFQESNNRRQNRRMEVPQMLLGRDAENRQSKNEPLKTGLHQKSFDSTWNEMGSADSIGGRRELWSAPERQQRQNGFEKMGQDTLTAKMAKVADLKVSDMVLDDICDEDNLQELRPVSSRRTIADRSYVGSPMDQHTAMELKMVLLGSGLSCFTVEWRNQGFTFSETHNLRYGFEQKKGGPCGVLASVQAFVLKKLLFESSDDSDPGLQKLRPSNATRRKCLVQATADILWRAGGKKQATVTINSGRNHFTPAGHYKSEGVLEKMTSFTLDNFSDLLICLEQHIEQFETGLLGCILLTVSAVLSRSIEKVREDLDVPTTALIGAHGYCTQELVNLLVHGRAVPNVFDNDMLLDSGKGNTTLLKGIKGQCDVGLLSLFEHYNICKVGAYLKTPCYPIWLVCSESHFSVLFGLQRALLTSQDKGLEFDLYYYDGLANQQEIRLTVSVCKSGRSCQAMDSDLIPPLEHCIRTRWKDASVNWNDTEPIL